MNDYISREAAINVIRQETIRAPRTRQWAIDMINHVPAADVEPVRHAEWELVKDEVWDILKNNVRDEYWRCSACKTWLPNGDTYDPDHKPNLKYCAECGAKMDGGAKS